MNEQIDIFQYLSSKNKYTIRKRIRLIELFGGIGSQSKALERLERDGLLPNGFEHYRLVEFDKYPVASYNAVHGTNFKPTDITKIHAEDLGIVDRDKYEYIMTYSFPCQDLSLAGNQKGMSKGSGTRSGLLWEVERLLNECGAEMPQILLMENVPQVIGEKNKADFKLWLEFLESKGYRNYYKILNAKDYGIPQNRQRCFMVSILGEGIYSFPHKQRLKLKLKDMLEENVEEKYYLSKKMIDYIKADNEKWSGNNGKSLINKDIASTINTEEGNRRCDASNYVSEDVGENYDIKTALKKDYKNVKETLDNSNLEKIEDVAYLDGYNRAIKTDGVAKTITTRVDASNSDFLLIKNATKKGYLKAKEGDGIDISSRMETHRGTVQKEMIQTIKASLDVGVVVKENLKTQLCNKLIEENQVEEGDVIKHSYTQQILDGNKKVIEKKDEMITLTTRADCLGVVVEDKGNYIQWKEDGRLDIDCRAYKESEYAPTTTTKPNSKVLLNNLRIRKLTPKECWRLMGFEDEDFERASKVNSNAQLYKQAGNSIVVNVLVAIFKELL